MWLIGDERIVRLMVQAQEAWSEYELERLCWIADFCVPGSRYQAAMKAAARRYNRAMSDLWRLAVAEFGAVPEPV